MDADLLRADSATYDNKKAERDRQADENDDETHELRRRRWTRNRRIIRKRQRRYGNLIGEARLCTNRRGGRDRAALFLHRDRCARGGRSRHTYRACKRLLRTDGGVSNLHRLKFRGGELREAVTS